MACGGISSTQQSGPEPFLETIDFDRQQADIVPIPEFADSVVKKGSKTGDLLPELFDSTLASLFRGSLRNHITTLPVFVAVHHDEDFSRCRPAQSLSRIAGMAAD